MRIISGKSRGAKLYSLDGIETRPTLDRVKESLFNILMPYIDECKFLDLFAGSGAIGLEALSRGATECVFCDASREAIKIINMNIEKTKNFDKSTIINKDFEKALFELKEKNKKFNIIFIDPPYKSGYIKKSIEKIIEYHLLEENGIIILETDEPNRILEELKNENIVIYDNRKYGRVSLLFANRKG